MKEVAVIGAGAAGLASMKSLLKFKDRINVTAYELSNTVGGVWVNRDPYKHTSMYDNLRINLPKELISFTNYELPDAIQESYVHHSVMLEYLNNFARDFGLHPYIKFRHRVVNVDPYKAEDGTEKWYVTVQNLQTGVTTTNKFDAVLVCNGHETTPYIPELEGVHSYAGEIIHSTYHQNSELYKGKTVLVLGALFSGTDVAMECIRSAKYVYLSHNNDRLVTKLPENMEETVGIEKFNGDDIILRDGSVVHADIVVLATGYRYDLSFLSERCRPKLEEEHIHDLYRMMISIDHPSLYFIGLNKLAVEFKEFGLQAELATSFIVGKIPQVSEEEMRREYQDLYKRLVSDLGKRPKDFHNVIEYQWEYHRILAEQSKTDEPIAPVVEKLTKHWYEMYTKSLPHFRDAIYKLDGEDNFKIVYEHPALKAAKEMDTCGANPC